jgi:uncharacterized spore protein YtfJ
MNIEIQMIMLKNMIAGRVAEKVWTAIPQDIERTIIKKNCKVEDNALQEYGNLK